MNEISNNNNNNKWTITQEQPETRETYTYIVHNLINEKYIYMLQK